MQLTRADILDFINQHQSEFSRKYYIQKMGLFGSFARNEPNESSDIDLIVEFKDRTPHLSEIKESIRTLFKNRFQRNVDLANVKYLKPYAKEYILRDVQYAR
jgi:hypothetical protein